MSTQLSSERTGTSLVRPHTKRKWLLLIALVGVLVAVIAAYPKITEEIAYFRGIEAYAYGLPLVMMDVSNQVMTDASRSGDSRAPINQF